MSARMLSSTASLHFQPVASSNSAISAALLLASKLAVAVSMEVSQAACQVQPVSASNSATLRFVLAGDQQLQRRAGVVVADETRRVAEEFGDALVVGEVATVDDDDDAALVTAHVGIHMLSPLVWSFDRFD
jgi:hypothetical protein